MANNTISQIQINGTTYDLLDAATRSTVSQLDSRVSTLEDSVGNVPSSITPLANTVSQCADLLLPKVSYKTTDWFTLKSGWTIPSNFATEFSITQKGRFYVTNIVIKSSNSISANSAIQIGDWTNVAIQKQLNFMVGSFSSGTFGIQDNGLYLYTFNSIPANVNIWLRGIFTLNWF